MVLGSHQLTGSVEILKQPFCVLHKKKKNIKKRKRQEDSESENEGDDGVNDDNDEISCYYEITGVVTRKLLFNQYPKIIMR